MPYTAVLFVSVWIAAFQPSEAAQAAHVPPAPRVPYVQGMQAMLAPMCAEACAGQPETCMPRCMEPTLLSVDPACGTDEQVCDAAGGMVAERMPACAAALSGLLTLSADSSVEMGLQVIADIYRACSVHVLCAAKI